MRDFDLYNNFGSDLNPIDYADSEYLLHEYQKRSISKELDANYEYDKFPKNFIFTKNNYGVPSNPMASQLDKLHTEAFITNKVKNIESVYVGSNELPEEYQRVKLPQTKLYNKCNCPNCNNNKKDTEDIDKAIEELQKRSEILTLLLVFIVIYCLVQMLYPTKKEIKLLKNKDNTKEMELVELTSDK
jgi:hypothetical protein